MFTQTKNNLICPECAYEWNPEEERLEREAARVKDVNGVVLETGDKVAFIKDLKSKAALAY